MSRIVLKAPEGAFPWTGSMTALKDWLGDKWVGCTYWSNDLTARVQYQTGDFVSALDVVRGEEGVIYWVDGYLVFKKVEVAPGWELRIEDAQAPDPVDGTLEDLFVGLFERAVRNERIVIGVNKYSGYDGDFYQTIVKIDGKASVYHSSDWDRVGLCPKKGDRND